MAGTRFTAPDSSIRSDRLDPHSFGFGTLGGRVAKRNLERNAELRESKPIDHERQPDDIRLERQRQIASVLENCRLELPLALARAYTSASCRPLRHLASATRPSAHASRPLARLLLVLDVQLAKPVVDVGGNSDCRGAAGVVALEEAGYTTDSSSSATRRKNAGAKPWRRAVSWTAWMTCAS